MVSLLFSFSRKRKRKVTSSLTSSLWSSLLRQFYIVTDTKPTNTKLRLRGTRVPAEAGGGGRPGGHIITTVFKEGKNKNRPTGGARVESERRSIHRTCAPLRPRWKMRTITCERRRVTRRIPFVKTGTSPRGEAPSRAALAWDCLLGETQRNNPSCSRL